MLHRQHPQPQHPPRLRAGDERIPGWCEDHRVPSITAVQPVHVAGYIEELTRARSAPTAKQRLSAIRHLFDWLAVGQVMPANPASSVRGPSHVSAAGARRDRREHSRGPARPRADSADPKGSLFRTIGRTTGQLTRTPLPQANAHANPPTRPRRRWPLN
jgi:hypothetical protein